MSSASVPSQPAGLGLNDVLNILWRRRILILLGTLAGVVAGFLYGQLVTPLHIASATVQPGITSFNAQALPVREWELKDISQWYKRGDYNPHLAVAMGEDPLKFRPIIRATFIPRGPQSRGGFTINLSTLSPSPTEAEQILKRSIDVFNAFAGSDSAFSNIHLMRVQVAANIEKQRVKITQVEGSKARARLQIESAEAEILAQEAARKLVERQVAALESEIELYDLSIQAHESMIASVRSDVGALDTKVEEWERLADQLAAERDAVMGSATTRDAVAMLVYANSLGDLIRDVGQLRLGIFDQAERILDWETAALELKAAQQELRGQIKNLTVERDVTIPTAIVELRRTAGDKQIELDYDLPLEESEAVQTLRAMEARLASLTPLEQIGQAVASARPVRPRKQRALTILTLLALASSIFASFTLEYLSKNWRAITRGVGSA